MKRNRLKSVDKAKLRWTLLLFFLCLSIPTAALVQQSYSRLKWETFHQHQLMADEFTHRINKQLINLVTAEEQRPFTDYAFLNIVGAPSANFVQRSPLSQFPVQSNIPGLIGYFQVDAAGQLLTPVIPEDIDKARNYGIAERELSARTALQNQIQQILSENRLVSNQAAVAGKQDKAADNNSLNPQASRSSEPEKEATPVTGSALASKLEQSVASPASEGQAVFDELKKMAPAKNQQEINLGRLEDLDLKQTFQVGAAKPKLAPTQEKSKGQVQKKVRTECWRRLKTDHPYRLKIDQGELLNSVLYSIGIVDQTELVLLPFSC